MFQFELRIYLKRALECGHQNCEEKKGAAAVKSSSLILQIVEHATNDKSHALDTGEVSIVLSQSVLGV